jgi:diguanylate cyclase (GGDEF)-like protein
MLWQMTANPPSPESATTKAANESVDAEMFELAPVSLWLEDYSGLNAIFTRLRAEGIEDLAAFLAEDPARITDYAAKLRVVKVNRRTLELFEASGLDDLVGNLNRVFGPDSGVSLASELVELWEGKNGFASQTVNYTLSGRRLDVQTKGIVLPGYEGTLGRVLVAVQDMTDRETVRRQLDASERYARGLFEYSPVSLWVEDFSAIKILLDDVRAKGITDFRVFLDVHEEFVVRCMREIRVISVNQHTLTLFRAPDLKTLMRRLPDILRDKMERPFKEQLIDLWDGKLLQQREVVNYTLNGDELYLHLQLSMLPGHEEDWALVQVALTDITARKKAEAYLEFLGKHDELTKLFNRSFYVDELNRLERKGPYPISVIIIDLNGLKSMNDQLGHLAGDGLLRRMGEVLTMAVNEPMHACRIGGDEFAILMPDTDERGGQLMVDQLGGLIEINNQYYSSVPLRISVGRDCQEFRVWGDNPPKGVQPCPGANSPPFRMPFLTSFSMGRTHGQPSIRTASLMP